MGCTASHSAPSNSHLKDSSDNQNPQTAFNNAESGSNLAQAVSAKAPTARKKVLQASHSSVVVPEETVNNLNKQVADDGGNNLTNFSSGLVFRDMINNADVSSALFNHVKRGEIAKFFELVKKNYNGREAKLHSLRGMWESTLLLVAMQYQQEEVASYLLDHSPSTMDDLNSINEKGSTAILYAVMEGMVDIVKRLIALNVKLSPPPTTEPIYNQRYDQAMICTPLMMAIINNQKQILGLLLDNNRCEVNQRFAFPTIKSIKKVTTNVKTRPVGVANTTPILLACAYGHDEIVKELMWCKCDFHEVDDDKSNILHHLARCREKENVPEIVKILLSQSCFDSKLIDGVDENGDTPLHVACDQKAHISLITALLEEGADASKLNLHTSFTPLHLAIRRREVEIIKLLLSYGADPMRKLEQQPSAYDLSLKLSPESEIHQLMQQATESWRRMNEIPSSKNNTVTSPPQNEKVEKEEIINLEDAVEDFTELDTTVMSLKPLMADDSPVDSNEINSMLDKAMIMMSSTMNQPLIFNDCSRGGSVIVQTADKVDSSAAENKEALCVNGSRGGSVIVQTADKIDSSAAENKEALCVNGSLDDEGDFDKILRARITPAAKRSAVTSLVVNPNELIAEVSKSISNKEADKIETQSKRAGVGSSQVIEQLEPARNGSLLSMPTQSSPSTSSTEDQQVNPSVATTSLAAKLTPKPPSEADKSGAFTGRRRSISGTRPSIKESAMREAESPSVNMAFSSTGGSGMSAKKPVAPSSQKRRDEEQNPKAVRIRR